MKPVPKGVWSYAILLVVLFAIASIAVWHTIAFLEERLPAKDYGLAAGLISSISLGFMLIAAAFGLWAIRFSSEAESLRRIGRVVETMDYLSDGLLAVDRKGRVTGSNPAASVVADRDILPGKVLIDAFPCLSDDDLALLLDRDGPNEVERHVPTGAQPRSLRFRSQPSEGLSLVLISDITTSNAQRDRNRQAARLQLIGQIARGVAHDFNNLLCAISGHSALLPRLEPGSPEAAGSLAAIDRDAERGIALAGHLLQLAQPAAIGPPAQAIADHIATAADILRQSLPENWRIETDVTEDLPPVNLTGLQFEQVILNLGLLCPASADEPRSVRIVARRPDAAPPLDVGPDYAVVVLVEFTQLEAERVEGDFVEETSRDAGVIESVIASLVQNAGGTVSRWRRSGGTRLYRVALRKGHVARRDHASTTPPEQLVNYVQGWTVLLAQAATKSAPLAHALRGMKLIVESVDNVASALVRVQDERDLDTMVLDKFLMGAEAAGLISAILKLRPKAGIVVLCEGTWPESRELAADIVCVASGAQPGDVLTAMIEAKTLALRRQTR